jgi:hypothetical protein
MISANYNSGAGDGTVYYSTLAAWATAHNATDGTGNNYTAVGSDVRVSCSGVDQNRIWRTFLPFNTSAISDNAVILSAKLYFYVHENIFNQLTDSGRNYVVVVQASQASPTVLANADFDQVGSVAFSNVLSLAGLSLHNWFSFDLNAAGIAVIKKTAGDPYTLLAIREGHDFENQEPTGTGHNIVTFGTSEVAEAPYLAITYTEIKKIAGVAVASVKKVALIPLASIKKINGLA